MCGIAGAVGTPDSTVVQNMVHALAHRGPDGSGLHSAGVSHIAVHRLSIIDQASGQQPIYNEQGDKCIVFNGEIYNYVALQSHLRARGHILRTRSDTEVILHLYEEYGDRCVDHLRGMFAFSIV